MSDFNALWQGRVGWRSGVIAPSQASTLWTSVYAVYNADAVGSSSLKTSLYAAYNGESNANDSFGTNNGTAVGGLTYTAGKIGNAFDLNGSNAYVSLPNNSLNLSGNFSYSAWVYFKNVPSGEAYIVSATNGNGGANNYGVAYGIISGKLTFAVFNNTSTSSWYSTILSPNTWYHVTVTKTASTAPKFYVNGTLQSTTLSLGTNTLNPVYTSGSYPNCSASIGTYRYNNGASAYAYANARIDAVNVWNKELTQSEITELYNSGNGAQYITDSFYKPTINDALNLRNGTAQGGLTYGVGKVGTAFKFNGTNAYVELGDVMDVGLNNWTYSFWFNASDASVGQVPFSKSFANGAIYGRIWSGVYNNRFNFNFQVGNSNVIAIETAANSIQNNTWYHAVCVLDRSDKLKIYLNGILQTVTVTLGTNSLPPYSNVNYNNALPFRIGAYTAADNTTPLALFNGQIDAFNVWNRVLTQSEITELYNSSNGKQYPN